MGRKKCVCFFCLHTHCNILYINQLIPMCVGVYVFSRKTIFKNIKLAQAKPI